MGFRAVQLPKKTDASGTGIKCACSNGEIPALRQIRVSLNREAQIAHFGRELDPQKDRFTILRGDDTDKGKLLIQLDPEGPAKAGGAPHGTVLFRIVAFPPLPEGAVKSTGATVISSQPGKQELVIRLPWHGGSQ